MRDAGKSRGRRKSWPFARGLEPSIEIARKRKRGTRSRKQVFATISPRRDKNNLQSDFPHATFSHNSGNLAREKTRHSRSNGATGKLKPRFTRAGEKLGKPESRGLAVTPYSHRGDRFSFRYKRDLRRPQSRGGKVNKRRREGRRDPEQTSGTTNGETVERDHRNPSIESAGSPQMQLNRTCRREVHLTVLLVSFVSLPLPPGFLRERCRAITMVRSRGGGGREVAPYALQGEVKRFGKKGGGNLLSSAHFSP
ncbi:hypothetical protein PUN28_018477 [Cardiocondyla obscurior]|uniref:Uncharacterized protein n=1 Tax=Cardiocondyla obscurior TaxID=286306 RepID=A0AAW2EG73_9HYME